MRRWAVQYGPHVRVLSPAGLAEAVKKDILQAAAGFGLIQITADEKRDPPI